MELDDVFAEKENSFQEDFIKALVTDIDPDAFNE